MKKGVKMSKSKRSKELAMTMIPEKGAALHLEHIATCIPEVVALNSKESVKFQKNDLIPLDLKKYAYIELLKENISNTNIDISNLCTYESNHNFHSWRRTKTYLRQWNFISS